MIFSWIFHVSIKAREIQFEDFKDFGKQSKLKFWPTFLFHRSDFSHESFYTRSCVGGILSSSGWTPETRTFKLLFFFLRSPENDMVVSVAFGVEAKTDKFLTLLYQPRVFSKRYFKAKLDRVTLSDLTAKKKKNTFSIVQSQISREDWWFAWFWLTSCCSLFQSM